MSAEQRGSARIRHPFMLRYRPAQPTTASWSVTPLLDLSSYGARFLSDQPLAKGQALEMHFMLPGSLVPVALGGEVAWVKTGGKLGLAAVGVSFTVPSETAHALLDQAVQHFLKRSA